MYRKIFDTVLENSETVSRCITCGEEFLRIDTAEFIEKTGTTRGRPDKWLVYALEHFYNYPDHELGCYTNGIRNMEPNKGLLAQIDKTNPFEIERFKLMVAGLPF